MDPNYVFRRIIFKFLPATLQLLDNPTIMKFDRSHHIMVFVFSKNKYSNNEMDQFKKKLKCLDSIKLDVMLVISNFIALKKKQIS